MPTALDPRPERTHRDLAWGRRALTGIAWGLAACGGAAALAAVFAGKSQRLYPGDAATGATVATEGVRPWMLAAFLCAAAALALLLASRAAARTATADARIAAVLAAAGLAVTAVVAANRLAQVTAEAANGRYEVVAGAGLPIIPVAACVGAAGALAYAVLLRPRLASG